MDHDEARRVLGVDPSAGPSDVRAAYRRLLRAHHPDVAGGTAEATATTAAITEAYRVLSSVAEPPPEAQPEPVADTIVLDLPPDDAYLALLDAATGLGVVTYVDADAHLFEVVVEPDGAPTCSLVVTLQGRATGVTEAFCTLVAVGAGEAPPVGPFAERLARHVRHIRR
jgi:hypothetical protein